MTTARKPIVVVGSINMDIVARTPRIALDRKSTRLNSSH